MAAVPGEGDVLVEEVPPVFDGVVVALGDVDAGALEAAHCGSYGAEAGGAGVEALVVGDGGDLGWVGPCVGRVEVAD